MKNATLIAIFDWLSVFAITTNLVLIVSVFLLGGIA